MSRMTSSLRPGGTVSDSISVTKPYLYGWRTWDSIPLLIQAPEVLCASQVAEMGPWRRRILQELLGIVNQASVDVAIHLPDQPLVVLRRIEIVDYRRVVHRHRDEVPLVGGKHRPRAVAGRGGAGRELGEHRLVPDDRLPALFGEAGDDGGGAGPPVSLEQALQGRDAHMRQIDRPRQDSRGANRLERREGGAERSDRFARDVGVFDDDALVGGQGGSDARGVGSPRVPWAYPFAPRPQPRARYRRDPCFYVIASCTPPPNPQIGAPWPCDASASWAIRSCESAASGSRTRSLPRRGWSRTICGIRSPLPGRSTRWDGRSRRRRSARRCGSFSSRWTSSVGR